MPPPWRIIDTGARDPFTNMALDEALLRGYELHDSPPTLRVYGWDPAGISLGYAQEPSAAAEAALAIGLCRAGSMTFVRRITGGGIILHGNELTYSLVCSASDLRVSSKIVSSYKVISSFLITFYKRLGLDAAFACDVAGAEKLGERSPLCFAAKEKYDIVIGGRKIGGSAQKRSQRSIFQHGSIPIAADPAVMGGAACLEELLGRRPGYRELAGLLVEAFRETFGVAVEIGSLTDTEAALCEELRVKKYSSDDWNMRRHDVTNQARRSPGLNPGYVGVQQ